MEKVFFFFGSCLFFFSSFSQTAQQNEIDSVYKLAKLYINEKSSSKLYDLLGKKAKKNIDADRWDKIMKTTYFKLGGIKRTDLLSYNKGLSKYKVFFALQTLFLDMSLDEEKKIYAFEFAPLPEDKNKPGRVH